MILHMYCLGLINNQVDRGTCLHEIVCQNFAFPVALKKTLASGFMSKEYKKTFESPMII